MHVDPEIRNEAIVISDTFNCDELDALELISTGKLLDGLLVNSCDCTGFGWQSTGTVSNSGRVFHIVKVADCSCFVMHM